ncbi:peptidoglycan-binding protein [Acidimicrobiaceae bacterium]|nr:peptidoglycan-binding protein [Acidimicrobiaceae bacterium]
MGKILITTLISILPFNDISHPHEEDPFTTYIQEKLIELGYLDVVTGVNDKTTQSAIKLFQTRSGLVVDGMVGDETFSKLMLSREGFYTASSNMPTLSEGTVVDDEPPVWDIDSPPYASEIGTLFNLNLPSVTDNVGIVSYEVYVNGALSSHANISETRLIVTPQFDMTCSDQIVYVIAYDDAGNSAQSPSFTIPQSDPCISTIASSGTDSTSSSASSVSAVFLVSFGSDGSGEDSAQSVHVFSGSHASIYITGYFEGTINFGGGDITSNGGKDIFVLSLNKDGEYRWAYTAGGTQDDEGASITMFENFNAIYVTGYFKKTVDFGSGDITSNGNQDIFVLKLDEVGGDTYSFQWVKTYGGSRDDRGYGVHTRGGAPIVTGVFRSSNLDFGGGSVGVGDTDTDIFVLALDGFGVYNSAMTISSDEGCDESGRDIYVGPNYDSDHHITGFHTSNCTIDFGGSIGELSSFGGGQDILMVRVVNNSVPTIGCVYAAGGSGNDRGLSVTVDSNENIYVTGIFRNTATFNRHPLGQTAVTVTSQGGSDMFIVKLNSSCELQWVYTAGGSENEFGYGLDVDRFDNIYATGVFKSTVDFGGGNVTASGVDFDAFTLKLNSSGVFQWVRTFGDNPGDESGNDIAAFHRYQTGQPCCLINYDNLITVGDFNGTVDFGNGNITSNSSSADMFILKLNFSGNIE